MIFWFVSICLCLFIFFFFSTCLCLHSGPISVSFFLLSRVSSYNWYLKMDLCLSTVRRRALLETSLVDELTEPQCADFVRVFCTNRLGKCLDCGSPKPNYHVRMHCILLPCWWVNESNTTSQNKPMSLSLLIITNPVPVKTTRHFIMDQVCWHPLSYYLSVPAEYVYPPAHMVTISATLTAKPQC